MATHTHVHDPDVAHHFESAEQQFESANLGMWVFLATEILFFGGLFCAYAVYRSNHPEIFLFAHTFLDKQLGAINTVVLICSSFTMAWAVRAAQLGQRRILQGLLALTFLCACGFLGIKYVEYSHKWHLGLLWARAYAPQLAGHAGGDSHGAAAGEAAPATAGATAMIAETAAAATTVGDIPTSATSEAAGPERSKIAPAATGPAGLAAADDGGESEHLIPEPANAQTFFSIYFLMTGLHGIHVLGGMGAMIWLFVLAGKGAFDGGRFTRVHMVGLYWHLVDLIWIYLFLLLYLIH